MVGLVAVIVFYILILAVGIIAGRKSKKSTAGTVESEEVMVAGRNIGLLVGVFTMTGSSLSLISILLCLLLLLLVLLPLPLCHHYCY